MFCCFHFGIIASGHAPAMTLDFPDELLDLPVKPVISGIFGLFPAHRAITDGLVIVM